MIGGHAVRATAGDTSAKEYSLKAAYLYHFTRFVQWTSVREGAEGDPISLCILGKNPFGGRLLEGTRGREVRGHPLRVQQLASPDEGADCHLVYIADSESERVRELISALDHSGLLTVSDIGGFADLGGAIELVTERSRVAFRVNLETARARELTISSQMLSLASEVIQQRKGPADER